MGTSFRCSLAIFSASTSTQITSLPVSAKQAPATRPTYPLPITAMCMSGLFRDCVASIDHQLCFPLDHAIIHRRVVGHDHHTIGSGYLLGRELAGSEFVPVFLELRDVRVEVRHLCTLRLEQSNDVECRTLADIFDVSLVRDTQHQHRCALHCLALAIQRLGQLTHPEHRHLGVQLSSQIDEPRLVVESPHLPREIVRIDWDAVPAEPRPREKLHEAEWLGGRSFDDFPYVHPELVAQDCHLVYKPDMHAPERVLQQLHQLSSFSGGNGN